MSGPILVAVDPFREDPDPPALATVLAEMTGRRVLAIGAYPEMASTSAVDVPAHRRAAYELALTGLGSVRERLPPDAEMRAVGAASPARALLDAAAQADAALVVLGSAHHGPIGQIFAGGVTDQLLHSASCPVAIAPRGYQPPAGGVRRVGAAFVDTPEGREALRGAAALARRAGAALQAITVTEPIGWGTIRLPLSAAVAREREATRDAAEHTLRGALAALPAALEAEPVVIEDGTAAALATLSTELDVLVCGSRGYGPARTIALGSVSHALSRHARCPLIVIPRGTERGLQPLLAAEAPTSGPP